MFGAIMALIIAFPKTNQSLAYYDKCYMIGAVEPGKTEIIVQGRRVSVHSSGAFSTMIELVEGTNIVEVAGSNHVFKVAHKPKPRDPSLPPPPPPKPYEKLEFAADEPIAHPYGKAPKDVTLVIDPGHGGKDPGSLSPHNLPEKDVNLRVAKAVKAELKRLGYNVVLTREDDSYPELNARAKLAKDIGADAFVSIHHNAPPPNKDPLELRYTAVYAWNDIGLKLGKAINKSMAEELKVEELKNNGVPQANYLVTRSPEIPSCLIEVDFITSPEGELACWDRNRQKRIARSIASGIKNWVETKYE